MKERKISVAVNRRAELLSALLMQFLLYHCAACTAVSLFYHTEMAGHYLFMALLLPPLFFLAFLRYHVKNFALFLLLHLIAPLFGLLAGRGLGEKLSLAGFLVLMLVVSISRRTTERWKVQENPSIGMITTPLLCYFLGYYMKNPLLMRLIYGELFAYMILYFLHKNLKNTTDFIEINKNTANFPAGQMTVVNRSFAALFLVVLAAAMVLFSRLHLEAVLFPVLRGLLYVIAWIFSLLPFSDASEQMQNTAQRMDKESPLEGLGTSETGLFWVIVEKILIAAVIALIAAAVIGGTAYLLYYLYKRFYAERKENTDEKEFVAGEIKWFSKGLFAGREDMAKDRKSFRNPRWRIRKAYKRYVKKGFGKRESVPAALTPQEMLALLGEKGKASDSASLEKIRAIYERARYSEKECTQKELEELTAEMEKE